MKVQWGAQMAQNCRPNFPGSTELPILQSGRTWGRIVFVYAKLKENDDITTPSEGDNAIGAWLAGGVYVELSLILFWVWTLVIRKQK